MLTDADSNREFLGPIFKSKMVHTPLGLPTTWVHILVETLVETTEYGMKKEVRSRRKH
jgi:hypothetical protein